MRLSTQDALWLTMDRPNNLMVIDTVMWFRGPLDRERVMNVLRERLIERFPVFRSLAVPTGNGWAWQEDPDFDLRRQVSFVHLPDPAGFRELQQWIGDQRSVPLDRSRPLWSLAIIEGLHADDGTVGSAVTVRTHHSMADGVRLTQVMVSMCDVDAEPISVGRDIASGSDPSSVAAAAAGAAARSFRDVVSTAANGLATTAGDILGPAFRGEPDQAVRRLATAVGDAGSAVRRVVTDPVTTADWISDFGSIDNRPVNDVASTAKLLLAPPSVATVWTGTPGIDKSVSWPAPVPLAEVKRIRRATGATVNDVMIGAVAGALTNYLREHGAEGVDELLWMVPVSVRPFDPDSGGALGNHFALVAVRLPIGVDDIRTRLHMIHTQMERIKNSDEPYLTYGAQLGISRSPAPIATALTDYFANKAVGVLTNVPGPQMPISFAGVEVDGMLGWAPCSGDQPLNICIFSYNGRVAVGFGSDTRLVPDINRLSELFAEEFARFSAEI